MHLFVPGTTIEPALPRESFFFPLVFFAFWLVGLFVYCLFLRLDDTTLHNCSKYTKM